MRSRLRNASLDLRNTTLDLRNAPSRRGWVHVLGLVASQSERLLALCVLLGCLRAMYVIPVGFSYWAFAGSALLSFAALRESASRRELLLLACLLPASLILMAAGNHAVVLLRPRTIDGELMRLDHGTGMAIYRWTLTHPYFKLGMGLVYCWLPFVVASVLVTSPERMRCAQALAVAGAVAPLFYLALPAVGPAHIGDPSAARNCVPSLHLSWVMLLARYSHPRVRHAAVAFALLTAAATLATGEHYVADLVVAVPYTLTIVQIANKVSPAERPMRQ